MPRLAHASLSFIKTDLIPYFSTTMEEAARLLDVNLSHFKKHYRKLGIEAWPFRRISSLKKCILNANSQEEVDFYTNRMLMVYADPKVQFKDTIPQQEKISGSLFSKTEKKAYQASPDIFKEIEELAIINEAAKLLVSFKHHKQTISTSSCDFDLPQRQIRQFKKY